MTTRSDGYPDVSKEPQGSPLPEGNAPGGEQILPPEVPGAFSASSEPWPPDIGDPGSWRHTRAALLSEPLFRPACVLDAGVLGGLAVRAASIRGQGHRFGGTTDIGKTRQDDYGIGSARGNAWLIVLVADGVSNSQHPHRAASLAVRVGTRAIGEHLDSGESPETINWALVTDRISSAIVRDALRSSGTTLPDDSRVEAAQLQNLAQVMATTAIAAVVGTRPDETGTVPYHVATLAGDSSAALLSAGAWTPLVGAKAAVEGVVNSSVTPLPGASFSGPPLSGKIHPGSALFLMTDGLGDPFGDGSGEVGRFLASKWATPRDVYLFAGELDFFRRTFDDDRTCVGVWLP